MKQKVTFHMKDGSKHSLKMEDPTNPDLFKECNFKEYNYIQLTQGKDFWGRNRTVTLNPKYVTRISFSEK